MYYTFIIGRLKDNLNHDKFSNYFLWVTDSFTFLTVLSNRSNFHVKQGKRAGRFNEN